MLPKYKVEETPCYPNAWFVYLDHPYSRDNATCNYFPTKELAQAEADTRNGYIF